MKWATRFPSYSYTGSLCSIVSRGLRLTGLIVPFVLSSTGHSTDTHIHSHSLQTLYSILISSTYIHTNTHTHSHTHKRQGQRERDREREEERERERQTERQTDRQRDR